MARPIFQCFVAVLLVGLVTSENSSQKNEKTQNIEIEPAMSRLIRPQVEKNLEEASSSRNAVFYNSPPTEGLAPPRRPNFQPIYHEKNLKTRHNDKSALNYRVPPVIVDNSTPHSHPKTGLKTGYFPPSTRVMPRVSHIEAECRDDFMKLRVAFNDSFSGLIYSAGYTHDHDCMYINGTGQNTYEFYIQLNRCGTLGGSDHHKRDVKNTTPTKNYMWNTVAIQYSPLIEEEWDEHFKVTCEYGYDFWKTVTFPFLEVDRSQLELSRTKRHFH